MFQQLPSTSASSFSMRNSRKRNNKNLSLCLSSKTAPAPDSSSTSTSSSSSSVCITPPPNTASFPALYPTHDSRYDNKNAYPNGPSLIMPYLYLGSEKNALDTTLLSQLGISLILNVAAEVNIHPQYNQHSIKLAWHHDSDIDLDKAIDIIDQARSRQQSVLVHCQCGIARSATVIIGYIMKMLHLPLQEAYHYAKRLAPPINPNLSLLFQLREYEQKLMILERLHQCEDVIEEPETTTASSANTTSNTTTTTDATPAPRNNNWSMIEKPTSTTAPVCC